MYINSNCAVLLQSCKNSHQQQNIWHSGLYCMTVPHRYRRRNPDTMTQTGPHPLSQKKQITSDFLGLKLPRNSALWGPQSSRSSDIAWSRDQLLFKHSADSTGKVFYRAALTNLIRPHWSNLISKLILFQGGYQVVKKDVSIILQPLLSRCNLKGDLKCFWDPVHHKIL